jgi:hypothetical protein
LQDGIVPARFYSLLKGNLRVAVGYLEKVAWSFQNLEKVAAKLDPWLTGCKWIGVTRKRTKTR